MKNYIMNKVQGTQAISRALDILRTVASSESKGMVLGRISEVTGLNKPTTHRILQALISERMIDKGDSSSRYFLGPECHVLGIVASKRFGITKIAEETVSKIANFCRDSAFLSIRSGSESVCVIREDGDYPLKTHVLQPGVRLPLGVVASGLAILSTLEDEDIEKCMNSNKDLRKKKYPAFTDEVLKQEIINTRQNGFALNKGSLVPGSWAIAVPILNRNGLVEGSLSIAAVESRLQFDRQLELIAYLKEQAKLLEQLL